MFGMAQLAELLPMCLPITSSIARPATVWTVSLVSVRPCCRKSARLRKPEARKDYPRRRGDADAGVGEQLNDEEIKALVAYVYTPIRPMPVWGKRNQRLAHCQFAPAACGHAEFSADPMNLFIVVEKWR